MRIYDVEVNGCIPPVYGAATGLQLPPVAGGRPSDHFVNRRWDYRLGRPGIHDRVEGERRGLPRPRDADRNEREADLLRLAVAAVPEDMRPKHRGSETPRSQ